MKDIFIFGPFQFTLIEILYIYIPSLLFHHSRNPGIRKFFLIKSGLLLDLAPMRAFATCLDPWINDPRTNLKRDFKKLSKI